ncbi:MAG: hypothetical protein MJ003_06680 [Paludibacteraceae bacterium]|nr:hypothetical protein [Paludibacteraceae bacterium]
MKKIIKVNTKYGPALRTRSSVEQIAQSMNSENEYLIDMLGVEEISRSAADELYNLKQNHTNVHIVHMTPFITNMLDIVTIGRFQPRKREHLNTDIVYCTDMESLREAFAQK